MLWFNLLNQNQYLLIGIKTLLFFGVFFLSLACGSSGGASGEVSIGETGDLKPIPQKSQKLIYQWNIDGEQLRRVKVITNIVEGGWTEVWITEGLRDDRVQHFFFVSDGRAFLNRSLRDSRNEFYSTPGKRLFVSKSEMPFEETPALTITSANGFGSFPLRFSYQSLGQETYSSKFGPIETDKISYLYEARLGGEDYETIESKTIHRSETYGSVLEDIVLPQRRIARLELIEVLDQGELNISVIENKMSRIGQDLSLVIPNPARDGVTQAEYEEILSLASNRPECLEAGELAMEYAQVCHLYQKYYLYSNRLPESLEGLEDISSYVDVLKEDDPYTFYLNRDSMERFLELSNGSRATVGVTLSISGGNVVSTENPLTFESITSFSRAWYDGLQQGDQLLEIDGQSISGLTLEEVQDRFPSTEGQTTTLKVLREAVEIEVATASETHIEKLMGQVGYLSLRSFNSLTPTQVLSDIDKLKEEAGGSLEGLVIDLRGNPGGILESALSLIDYFISQDTPEGENKILSYASGKRSFYLGDHNSQSLEGLSSGNIVVLQDEGSASASEVLVTAFQNYGYGEVIGEKSFGKGVSQILIQLVDGSGVAITREILNGPNDQTWQDVGILPGICYSTSASSPSVDPQLQAALEYIQSGNVTGAETCPELSSKPIPLKQRDPLVQSLNQY